MRPCCASVSTVVGQYGQKDCSIIHGHLCPML